MVVRVIPRVVNGVTDCSFKREVGRQMLTYYKGEGTSREHHRVHVGEVDRSAIGSEKTKKQISVRDFCQCDIQPLTRILARIYDVTKRQSKRANLLPELPSEGITE